MLFRSMNKRLFAFLTASALTIQLAACSSGTGASSGCSSQDSNSSSNSTASDQSSAGASAQLGEITVVTRENGSGTRGAFIELMGIERKNDAGNKVDYTTDEAIIANQTAVTTLI